MRPPKNQSLLAQRINRNSSFELLRIFAMLLVIFPHATNSLEYSDFVGPGAGIALSEGPLLSALCVTLIRPFMPNVGIGVFFALAGYFLVMAHPVRFKKLFRMACLCLFYALVSLVIFLAVLHGGGYAFPEIEAIGANRFLWYLSTPFAVFRSYADGWWFVGIYFILCMVSPRLNAAIRSLSRHGFFFVFLLLFCWHALYAVGRIQFPAFFRGLFYYGLGAGLRLYGPRHLPRYVTGMLFLATWLLTGLVGLWSARTAPPGIVWEWLSFFGSWTCNGLLIPLAVVALLSFFEECNLAYSPFINGIARTTFGIYLFHTTIPVSALLWHTNRAPAAFYWTPSFPIRVVLDTIGVFVVCSVFEWAREKCLARFCPELVNILYMRLRKMLLQDKR